MFLQHPCHLQQQLMHLLGLGPVKPLIVVLENKAEDFEDDWTEAAEFHPSNLNFNIHPT